MENKYKRLGKNTLLVFIGNVGSRLIALLMLPLYTSWLSPSEYGITDVLTVYATLLSAFVGVAISDAIFIFPKSADEEERKSYFSSGIAYSLTSFVVALCLFFLLDIIFQAKGIHNSFSEYIWYVYFLIVGSLCQSYTQQFSRAIDKMLVYSMTGVVHTAAIAIGAFVFIPHFGVKGYLVSIICSYFVTTIYTFFFSKQYRYVSLKSIKKSSLITLLKYSIPLVPNGIMFWLINSLSRPMVESNIGLEANGVLAVASKFPGIISMLFAIFSNAWTISMMEEFGKKDFIQFFNTATRCVMFPSVVTSCLFAIFSKQIIMLFADPRYLEAYLYMPVITLGILMSCLGGLIGGIFAAKKQSRFFLYSSVWGAVVSVIGMYLLIPLFKLYGVAISTCLSYFVIMIVRYFYAKNDLRGFEFNEILLMLALYTVVAVVVVLDINFYIKLVCYLVIISILVIHNRALMTTIWEKLPIRNSFKKER